ncbi:SHOCT domain-containing protein [Phytohabitans sp. ZYX-F-186]|uniref:SHOCT domain-containing protein n=1 Tax=Phytohabitans maris TaxID=3071409 RepID=A0ABU0ZAH2_9ACTN|nr:SHOCT domain-containing protein [Phytohabitans sp. ZYX-F-186]MDQ7904030.1 SHOCT domain-containing protein [Phytohabitans sp. ZYX-F-186]
MGLFDRFKRISDPVEGSARVVSATGAPDGQGSAACGMHLVVTVPGVPAFVVQGTYLVKMAKWPWPGQVLPIVASRSEPARFKIRWDLVPTGSQAAAERAARLAESLNSPTPAPVWPAPEGQQPRPDVGVAGPVFVNGRPATAAEADQIAAMLGAGLRGDGGAPAGGQDRLERLERLAALHRSGAISAAEYERLKAEILDGRG